MIKHIAEYFGELSGIINGTRRIFLYIDYDGTLVGFKKNPLDAIPSVKVKRLITSLAGIQGVILTIVSGRTIQSLLRFFGDFDKEAINWSGVHGAQIKYAGEGILIPASVKKIVPVIEELKKKIFPVIRNVPCYILEDKGFSFSIHYRKCKGGDLAYLTEIESILRENIEGRPAEVMMMKKVIELKPQGINKGKAIRYIGIKYGNETPSTNICIGDDLTDEYMFESNDTGINIKVGEDRYPDSNAGYYLKNVSEVHQFLEAIYNALKK
ncbi:MAG: trehalose-phosphatase [Actinobacteria bacterium]|nr:trehalose-phosphatase [Actinomycetota bacterium]